MIIAFILYAIAAAATPYVTLLIVKSI